MSCCAAKDQEIAYLKALLALDVLSPGAAAAPGTPDLVVIRQKQALLKQQLALIRADVQYLNKQVQAVLQWITKVISVFLTTCGWLGETAAAKVVESASNLSRTAKVVESASHLSRATGVGESASHLSRTTKIVESAAYVSKVS